MLGKHCHLKVNGKPVQHQQITSKSYMQNGNREYWFFPFHQYTTALVILSAAAVIFITQHNFKTMNQ